MLINLYHSLSSHNHGSNHLQLCQHVMGVYLYRWDLLIGMHHLIMNKQEIEKYINSACRTLYKKEPSLVRNRAHERTLAGVIFCYLRNLFHGKGWDVDIEYNREEDEGDPKCDVNGKMIPDIVIHKRGLEGPNLVAIEIKGYWNKTPRKKDKDKLLRMRKKYGYKYLYRIELNEEYYELLEVVSVNSE